MPIDTNGNGSDLKPTLGEVYRAVLRVEAGLQKHEDGHVSQARWQVTTLIAVGGLLIAILKLFQPAVPS